MSIALLIEYQDSNKNELVPVATEESFKEYWLPAVSRLSLEWIPLFETGVPLAYEDIGDVCRELEMIITWMERSREPDVPAAVIYRARNLLEKLTILRARPECELYIG
jgi:hypothetical protein